MRFKRVIKDHREWWIPPENWLAEMLRGGETLLTLDPATLQQFERGDVIEIVDRKPGTKREERAFSWSTRDVRLVTNVLDEGRLVETKPTDDALAHACDSYVRLIGRAVSWEEATPG